MRFYVLPAERYFVGVYVVGGQIRGAYKLDKEHDRLDDADECLE